MSLTPRVQNPIFDVIWLFIYNWGFYLPKFNSSEMLCILGDVSNQRQPIHEQWWWEREAGDRGGREAVLDCGCLAPPVQMMSVIWLSTGPEPARLCSYGCLDIFIIFILNSRAYYLLPSYIWCPRDEEFSPNEECPWETHKGTKRTTVHGTLRGQGGFALKSWVFCPKEA